MSVTPEQLKELHSPFPADQVHWRAQTVVQGKSSFGALALAYLDSRDVQDRLDSVLGIENWQNEHYDANGKMACKIGILINDNWIFKSDGSGDTDIEAEKGAFSGALKRSAVLWGVGRYLYDLGNVWVPCEVVRDRNGEPKKNQKGKFMFQRFTENPWKHVRNAHAFLPKIREAAE